MTRPTREAELVPPVSRFLEGRGFRVWVDPDGTDYLDVVAKREAEVGLIELKLSNGRKLLGQALRRRSWGTWSAVGVPGRRLAEKLVEWSSSDPSARVGVWCVAPSEVTVLREARPWVLPREVDPFPEARARFAELLARIESTSLDPGVRWGHFGLPGSAPGRPRSSKDFRLEEFRD